MFVRLVRSVLAWIVAVPAASLALILPSLIFESATTGLDANDLQGAVVIWTLAMIYMAGLTAAPWTALVWLGRLSRAPRPWWDAGAGAVMAMALSQLMFGDGFADLDAERLPLFAFAGIVGGLVYWLAAGRPGPRAVAS